jgi:hypothetical protein
MTKVVALYVFVVLILFSCRQEKPKPPSYTIVLSQTLKDYAYFRPGTYWIYEDSASHALDSVYVLNASYGTNVVTEQQNLGYTGSFGFYKEQFAGSLQSSIENEWVDMSTSMHAPGAVLFHDKAIGGKYTGQNFLMTDVFTDGYTTYSNTEPNGSLTFVQGFDTLRVLNNTFHKVALMYDKKNLLEGNNRTNTYIAKNMGVVRRELLDSNKVWNLKRYNIVQ